MTHILLIDDDEAVLDSTRFFLMTCGFVVSTAENGKNGLTLFDKFHPDIVVTDILMPEMEGLETIRHLRQRDPALPILAVSGAWQTHSVDWLQIASGLGATETLHKPFTQSQLMRAIERCMPASQKCRTEASAA